MLAGCLLILVASATPTPTPAELAVTVVVRGDPSPAARVKDALGKPLGAIHPQVAELPNVPAPAAVSGDVESRLATARKDWVNGDFPGCAKQLTGDTLVQDLLADARRDTAARVLLWRAACASGAGDAAGAAGWARELAVHALDTPAEVSSVTPEVELSLANARKAVAALPPATLEIKADVASGWLSVDGRPAVCAIPCPLTLPPGPHVVKLEADAVDPVIKTIRLEPGRTELTLTTTPAAPAAAAAQWTARYAHLGDVDSAPSIRLLSTALRAPRLVLLTAEKESSDLRLRGVLAVDGGVVARTERRAADTPDLAAPTDALLRDLMIRGKLIEPAPPLTRRWTFWAIVGATALATGAAAAAAASYQPPVHTKVVFGP